MKIKRNKLIRRAKLYAVISENGEYSRVPIAFDQRGKPIEPKPRKGHVTSYKVRVAGKFIDAGVGDNFTMAVTRLMQEQARVAEGSSRTEAVKVVFRRPSDPTNGRTRISDAAVEFVSELKTLDRKYSPPWRCTGTRSVISSLPAGKSSWPRLTGRTF